MKRISLAVLLVGLLAWPAAATADTVRRFRAVDTGSQIKFGVTVCTNAPHSLRFYSYQRYEVSGVTYRSISSGRQGSGCERWVLSEADKYASGFWIGRMTVVIGGVPFKTGARYFRIR